MVVHYEQLDSAVTPQQALRFVDEMCARAPGTRADHAAIQEALLVLSKLVNPVVAAPAEEAS